MILAENYEEGRVLEDLFFPITTNIDDQRYRLGVILTGRLDANPDVDAELAWALVQSMKEQMRKREHFPNDGKTRQRVCKKCEAVIS